MIIGHLYARVCDRLEEIFYLQPQGFKIPPRQKVNVRQL